MVRDHSVTKMIETMYSELVIYFPLKIVASKRQIYSYLQSVVILKVDLVHNDGNKKSNKKESVCQLDPFELQPDSSHMQSVCNNMVKMQNHRNVNQLIKKNSSLKHFSIGFICTHHLICIS